MEIVTSIEGFAFLGDELSLRPVRIEIADGIIRSIEELNNPRKRWILPALFNAHTHIGDAVAMDLPVDGDLESIVTPPDGLKHRILRATERGALVSAMHATIGFMEQTGCAGFADFREGGVEGVEALLEAANGMSTQPLIFGREGGELTSDGFGISSVRDLPNLDSEIEAARRAGHMIAIHAGERDNDDIEGALAYEPDLLIHCTHASRTDLRRCADEGIPIAICPRSNWILGVTRSPDHPPVQDMIDLGCRVFLGTDNAMFVQPDLWHEMAFLSVITDIPARTILEMGISGSSLTGDPYWIEEGRKASIIEVNPEKSNLNLSRDPARTLVTRGCSCHLDRILF